MPKETKSSLTAEEQIEVAYWHIVRGYNQHDIAAMYGVNPGRVAEACKSVAYAVASKDVYKVTQGTFKIVPA